MQDDTNKTNIATNTSQTQEINSPNPEKTNSRDIHPTESIESIQLQARDHLPNIKGRIADLWASLSGYFDSYNSGTDIKERVAIGKSDRVQTMTPGIDTHTELTMPTTTDLPLIFNYPLPITNPCIFNNYPSDCKYINETIRKVKDVCQFEVYWGDLALLSGFANVSRSTLPVNFTLRQTYTFQCIDGQTVYVESLLRNKSDIEVNGLEEDAIYTNILGKNGSVGMIPLIPGWYPFTYVELMNWGSKYFGWMKDPVCGFGVYCGYPFIIYRSPKILLIFEVYETTLPDQRQPHYLINFGDICKKLLGDLINQTMNADIRLWYSFSKRQIMLHTIGRHMFKPTSITNQDCSNSWWTRMAGIQANMKLPITSSGNSIKGWNPSKYIDKTSRSKRQTSYNNEMSLQESDLTRLIESNLEGVWF